MHQIPFRTRSARFGATPSQLLRNRQRVAEGWVICAHRFMSAHSVHVHPALTNLRATHSKRVGGRFGVQAARAQRSKDASWCAAAQGDGNIGQIEELHATFPFDNEELGYFMKKYWQKRPVVIRGALQPGEAKPIDSGELAGLACESDFQPRILKKGSNGPSDWSNELGPFTEEELQSLPTDGSWCVVVNDLEKHIPAAAKLLDNFDRFPRWRVADMQASLCAEGGGVGAHSDQFDVFLMQGEGRKRWSISDDPKYAPEKEESFFENIDVRVLKDFQPKACSLLEPGDVLYLPPKVAHHGIAEGCDAVCVTYSIGFLAPTHDDLILSYAQSAVDTRNAVTERWSDPWLEPQAEAGQISQTAVTRAGDIIRDAMPKTEADIARWFGCHVTGSVGFDGEQAMPEEKLNPDEVQEVWAEEGALIRRADVKFAFIDEVADGSLEGCLFFAGGEVWELKSPGSAELARHIANNEEIPAEEWQGDIDGESVALVHDLFSNGFLYPDGDCD